MSTVFLSLPANAANGAGTAVDVSTLGSAKTLIYAGNNQSQAGFIPSVTIEVSMDTSGTNWTPVYTFLTPGTKTITTACHWMRAVVGNYRGGTAPATSVGAAADNMMAATLTATAGNGDGTAVDCSTLADFKSVQVAGTFTGTVNIQISDDNTNYVTAMSFTAPAVLSGVFTAKYMRASRSGVGVTPGTPVISINSASATSSGEDDINPIVFRPGDPAGSHDNVFTTWTETYAAIVRMRGRGRVMLEFDDSYTTPVVIPAGTWEMNGGDVYWDAYNESPTCDVELADGCSITCDMPPGSQKVMTFTGTSLRLRSNRTGPIAPFVGISLVLIGNRCRILNTSASALPMIEVSGANQFIAIAGNDSLGGIGDGIPALPAPLIDLKGGSILIAGGHGFISDNALTDTVGGGTATIRVINDGFCGDGQAYNFPGLAGSTLSFLLQTRDRYRMNSVVTSGPYAAGYNELVLVSTAGGAVTVNAPRARPSKGDRLVVKDSGGQAGTNNITIAPTGGDTIEGGTISTNNQCKMWVSDGAGKWWLTSVA